MVEVRETPLAQRQAARLRGPARKAYEMFLDELATLGCAALGYRLTGPDPLPRLCVRHLRGEDRVVVAFDGPDLAWVLLIGAHAGGEQERDVYDTLYELAGVTPADDEKRTKPRCCGESELPPDGGDLVGELVGRARALARGRRG